MGEVVTALSVLITARNEAYLPETVADVLAHAEGDTDVIVVIDGEASDRPLSPFVLGPRVRVLDLPAPIGQRAAINLAARHTDAEYVMKLDAHCSLDQGFDVKLLAALEGHHDWTMVPAQRNLHVFDWRCLSCGERTYMGPALDKCAKCGHAEHERVMVWKPRGGTTTDFWRFDHDLHFQYRGQYRGRWERSAPDGDIRDTLSLIGACWAMSRARYWELGGMDEAHGSWGQMGTEIACKSWLSGGRLVVHKGTWFAHLFRTRADFSFPYAISGNQVNQARKHSMELWLNDGWEGQVYSLAWLINKFKPLPGWHEPVGRDRLAHIRNSERAFYATHPRRDKVLA